MFNDDQYSSTTSYFTRELKVALSFGRRITECRRNPSAIGGLIQDLCDAVSTLDPGSRLILPGGWSCRTGSGHAVMYVIERSKTSPASFDFTVCNTGCGIQYHKRDAVSAVPKTKYQTALNCHDIPIDRIASPDVWYMILQLIIVPSDLNGEKILYEVILPHLAANTVTGGGQTGISLYNAETESRGGGVETPQRSGTCYYRCVLSALRFLCRKDGLSSVQQKQLMYALGCRSFGVSSTN